MHVADIKDPFVPMPLSKLSYSLADERERIDMLIDKIHSMYT